MTRFSLRGLLLLVAVAAAGIVVWDRSEGTQKRRTMAWIESVGGEIWMEGDKYGKPIPNSDDDDPEPKVRWVVVFPHDVAIESLTRLDVFDRLETACVHHHHFAVPILEAEVKRWIAGSETPNTYEHFLKEHSLKELDNTGPDGLHSQEGNRHSFYGYARKRPRSPARHP